MQLSVRIKLTGQNPPAFNTFDDVRLRSDTASLSPTSPSPFSRSQPSFTMAFLLPLPLQRTIRPASTSAKCPPTAAEPPAKPRRRGRARPSPEPALPLESAAAAPPPPAPVIPSAAFTEAETSVLRSTGFSDARYGTCFNCGAPIAIPGLERFFCGQCGWMRRAHEPATISPGHHD